MTRTRWTTLPPVALQGVGTHLVESLEHYVARIADHYALSLPALYRELYPQEQRGNRYPKVHINGLGKGFSTGVKAIEELTGVTALHCGTFLNLQAFLNDRGVEFQGRYRRWCPRCLGEWGPDAYEPLIWRFGDLPVCTIHGCALLETCAKCGKRQYLPAAYDRRRLCGSCKSPLAGSGSRSDVDDRCTLHTQRCAMELIEICSDPDQAPVPYAAYEAAYDAVMSDTTQFNLSELRLIFRHRPPAKTSCRRLIDMCAMTSVGPRTLLLGPREAISAPMLIGPYLKEWGARGTEGSATRPLRRLLSVMDELMAPRRLPFYAPSLPRLLRLVGVGRNVVLDSAPASYARYERFHDGQARAHLLRRAEATLSAALVRLTTDKRRRTAVRWFSRTSGALADETGVSTIIARKCLRTAMFLYWM